MAGPLRLRAEDGDDIAVIAACLQDALVPVGDLAFLSEEGRFVGVFNRFCWETTARQRGDPPPEGADAGFADDERDQRVLCALCFEAVREVTRCGLDRRDPGRLLELLTIEPADGSVTLIFAEGVKIRLEVDRIRCLLRDLVEPWPTQWRPRHDQAADGGPHRKPSSGET
jgi:hypothetical protein